MFGSSKTLKKWGIQSNFILNGHNLSWLVWMNEFVVEILKITKKDCSRNFQPGPINSSHDKCSHDSGGRSEARNLTLVKNVWSRRGQTHKNGARRGGETTNRRFMKMSFYVYFRLRCDDLLFMLRAKRILFYVLSYSRKLIIHCSSEDNLQSVVNERSYPATAAAAVNSRRTL